MGVVFGDGDVDLALHGPEQFMQAVGGVGDKGDTIDRGRRFDAIWRLGGRSDGELTSHAITPRPRSGGHPPPLRGPPNPAQWACRL